MLDIYVNTNNVNQTSVAIYIVDYININIIDNNILYQTIADNNFKFKGTRRKLKGGKLSYGLAKSTK